MPPAHDENVSLSRDTVTLSRCPVSAQKPGPFVLAVPRHGRHSAQARERVVGHARHVGGRLGQVGAADLDGVDERCGQSYVGRA